MQPTAAITDAYTGALRIAEDPDSLESPLENTYYNAI
jgi:hypothetical protein